MERTKSVLTRVLSFLQINEKLILSFPPFSLSLGTLWCLLQGANPFIPFPFYLMFIISLLRVKQHVHVFLFFFFCFSSLREWTRQKDVTRSNILLTLYKRSSAFSRAVLYALDG